MYCRCCGAQMDDDAIFCSKCGTNKDSNENFAYCEKCGTKISDGDVFCTGCGNFVSEDAIKKYKEEKQRLEKENKEKVKKENMLRPKIFIGIIVFIIILYIIAYISGKTYTMLCG